MMKALSEFFRKVKEKEQKRNEKKRQRRNTEEKKGKERKENNTNWRYVIKLGINLSNIELMYNVTSIYPLFSSIVTLPPSPPHTLHPLLTIHFLAGRWSTSGSEGG